MQDPVPPAAQLEAWTCPRSLSTTAPLGGVERRRFQSDVNSARYYEVISTCCWSINRARSVRPWLINRKSAVTLSCTLAADPDSS